MQPTGLVSPTYGKIRNATLLDAPELSRLIGKASPARANTLDLLAHGHLLVLELGNTLGAAIHVDVAGNRATVSSPVVDPELRGQHIAARMSGVAHALCEAYGYDVPDATAELPRGATARGHR